MSESIIEKHLKKLTIFVAVLSLAILTAGGIVTFSLNRVQQDAIDSRIQREVEKYSDDLHQKLQVDFQTIYTLSAFLEFNEGLEKESFSRGLLGANNHNGFVQMGYFGRNGTGVRVTRGKSIEMDKKLEEVTPEMQEIIRKAWEGEDGFSGVIYDVELEKQVLGYAVPVYRGEEIIGALVATGEADSLKEILTNDVLFGGNGHIQLINSQGEYVLPYETEDIFSGDYFSQKEEERITDVLDSQESCFASLEYKEHRYRLYIEPVGIKDWSLFGIEAVNESNKFLTQMILITRVTFSVILAAVIVFIFYGYRLMKKKNWELIQYAYYDSLTGAFNSEKFQQELAKVMKKQETYALAGLNIRQFKFINEIFGRNQADSLLCHVKDVLEETTGEGEYFCRNSADMFLVLLKGEERKEIQRRIQDIMEKIAAFSANLNHDYDIQMYCGISLIPQGIKTDTATMQTTHTMFALEKARSLPRNSIWFYDLNLHQEEILQNYVESHMNQALENGEFKMYLQPKFDLRTGRLSGAEALVRWIRGDGKVIYPGQFIPIFESNGFCTVLDMYMTEQVCRLIRKWIDQGIRPIPVSVNHSKILFYETDYVGRMEKLIEKYETPARWITLEILEGLAMENIDKLNQVIASLKEIGFRISMDDFGSGYSSLNTLGKLDIDELKLDKGFMEGIDGTDQQKQKIILEHIIMISRSLEISTVAEGIETKENEQMIQELGCDFGQGYYYCRPIPAEEFHEKYMQKGKK